MPIRLLSFHESPLQILKDEKARQSLLIHFIILILLILLGAINHFTKPIKTLSQKQLDGSKDQLLAKIHSMWIYPIKSCAGIQLSNQDHLQGDHQHHQTDQFILKKGFQFDRKWCVVDRNPASKNNGKVISLREENRLTLIRPSFSQSKSSPNNHVSRTLRLEISSDHNVKNLPPIQFLLEPSDRILKEWKEEQIEIWEDKVFGRLVELFEEEESERKWKGSPSDWISEFLGYRVQLLQFSPPSLVSTSSSTTNSRSSDSNPIGSRKAWPIYKPPLGFSSSQGEWQSPSKRKTLTESRGLEFQDEYPFLVTSLESLEEINFQIQKEVQRSVVDLENRDQDPVGDEKEKEKGFTTRPIGGFEAEIWKGSKLQMQRFRPNIVLESLEKGEKRLKPFNEDSFESLFVLSPQQSSSLSGLSSSSKLWATSMNNETKFKFKSIIHLVARCERCRLTTVDPEDSKVDKTVPLKFLARQEGGHFRIKKKRNGPCFGIYGIPEEVEDGGGVGDGYGTIRAGDLVVVRWRPYELDDEPERIREKDTIDR